MKTEKKIARQTYSLRLFPLSIKEIRKVEKLSGKTFNSFIEDKISEYIAKYGEATHGLFEALSVCYLCKLNSEPEVNIFYSIANNDEETEENSTIRIVCPHCCKRIMASGTLTPFEQELKQELLDTSSWDVWGNSWESMLFEVKKVREKTTNYVLKSPGEVEFVSI